MAEEQDRTGDSTVARSTLLTPRFFIAGGVVAVIAVLGVIVGVRAIVTEPAPSPAGSGAPTSDSAPTSIRDPAASICGLPNQRSATSLPTAPAANWEYEGTVAYPTSGEFGPGKTAPEGYRYCFQHSLQGALLAAANALGQPLEATRSQAWAEYFVSSGSGRTRILDQLASEPAATTAGVRVKIVGFRILKYSGATAGVDIAVEASGNALTVLGSYVYELVWDGGDWKLNSGVPEPFNFASIPDVSGYVPWGA